MTGKRVFIKNYGCQMNAYDAAKMAAVLARAGWQEQTKPDNADLVILNGCHIREKAAEKIYSDIGRMPKSPLLGVAGCVAQAEGEAIFARSPRTDFIFGPQMTHALPQLVGNAMLRRRDKNLPRPAALDFAPKAKFHSATPAGGKVSAFLTIQEGCDKFCAFCVVPYTRGAEFSRPAKAILKEARSLAAKGAKEIILLGQNVNAWHGKSVSGKNTWRLAQLLEALAQLSGLVRLRYTTSHPCDLTPDLIAAHGSLPQLMPQLHLPLQSGSNKILKAMNRRHRLEDYLEKIASLRQHCPDIALSSDFIVGFPGESEEDFALTLEAVRRAQFAHGFIFRYSPRPGTPAAGASPVAKDIVAARMKRLQELIGEQALAFNRRFVGRRLPVLLEQNGEGLKGRTPHGVRVELDCPEQEKRPLEESSLVEAEIVHASPYGFKARAD